MPEERDDQPLEVMSRKGAIGGNWGDVFCRLSDRPDVEKVHQLCEEVKIHRYWNAFHESMQYPDWESFNDKERFCARLPEIPLDHV